MSAPTWVSEVPADHGTLRYHADIADAVRERPRRFRLVGSYAYRGSARDLAACIRRGGSAAWRRGSGGHYEAKFTTTEDGMHLVYVRWIPDTTARSAA